MNYSFEYIDIILLAMIAGFIFLRLRGILGKRTGFSGKVTPQFQEVLKNMNPEMNIKQNDNFDLAEDEFVDDSGYTLPQNKKPGQNISSSDIELANKINLLKKSGLI